MKDQHDFKFPHPSSLIFHLSSSISHLLVGLASLGPPYAHHEARARTSAANVSPR
jgi:hypothetical protein